MAKSKIKVKINKNAGRELLDDASKRNTIEELEIDCPNCGEKIPIKGAENVCECGFILKAFQA